jgi:hypothetical protein
LTPLSPEAKYKMEGRHEGLVEPPGIEGSMPVSVSVYELHSPNEGEYGRMGRVTYGSGRRF